MSNSQQLRLAAWLPEEWGHLPPQADRDALAQTDVDVILVPENHDEWSNRDRWRELATNLGAALYVGLERGGWTLGLWVDPIHETEYVYTKHTTSEKISFEREEWRPEEALVPVDHKDASVGLTICHDHYISPLMGYQGLHGADLLLNLSGSPVKRYKWGEILQARAIENGAYTACTMHGQDRDGSVPRNNKGHVFLFDPRGDPVPLTDLHTGDACSWDQTAPGNLYMANLALDRTRAPAYCREPQSANQSIERVRTNQLEETEPTDSTLDIRPRGESIDLAFRGDEVTIDSERSAQCSLAGEKFAVVTLSGETALEPDHLYQRFVDAAADYDDRTLLLHNRWESLDETHLQAVIEPVLRARCVEWCSPVLLTTPRRSKAYQLANTAKTTHELPRDEDGRYNFETNRAWGVRSALKPIHQGDGRLRTLAYEKLPELAASCADLRINAPSSNYE